jgi:MoxR-like ATPase
MKKGTNGMNEQGADIEGSGAILEEGSETGLDIFRKKHQLAKDTIGKVFIGHSDLVEDILTAILCNGHVLIEGVPGLGKTHLVKTLSRMLDLNFSRIQFTPDLMPSDIIGTNILVEDENRNRSLRFEKGPVFANIVLADEINRATPKTQSALLEVMQEHQVTVGGKKYPQENPFFVMATQNPIELEGTYPLPEAQLDRFFFKLKVPYPSYQIFQKILDLTEHKLPSMECVIKRDDLIQMKGIVDNILISKELKTRITLLVMGTHPDSDFKVDMVKKYVRYGASPRGGQALVKAAKVRAAMNSRLNVSDIDIRRTASQALRHRILLNFAGEAENIDPDIIIKEIVKKIW